MNEDSVERKKRLAKYRAARKKRNMIIGVILASILILAIVGGAYWWYKKSQEDEDIITFAYQDRVADAVSIIAVEKGFFKEEGLKVRPMVFSSGPACTEALTYGNAQLGTMGDTTALITVSTMGDSFNIICSHGGGEHRHRIMVSKNSAITNITQLEGKKIGVKKGTSTHGGLLLFAKTNGMDLDDELIDMKPSLQLTALAGGELDAIVASEPTPSQVEAKGYGRELCTLGNLNNTYPILIVANKEYLNSHSDHVSKFINALKKAAQFIKDNPMEAAKIQSKITGLDEKVIENAMAFHYYDVGLDQKTLDSLDGTADFLLDIHKIDKKPHWESVIHQSIF